MSPRTPKSKRNELPKPVIQPDSVGFLPLNAWTVSMLYQGIGQAILGYRDTAQTVSFKANPSVQIQTNGTKTQTFSLDGGFYNGYTDALYRGKLPSVLIAAPSPDGWQDLLNDFVEYIENLLALGFFIPKKELIKRDPVSERVPCFILTGSGLMFGRFITGLIHCLRQLGQQNPSLTEEMQLGIIARFVRGLPHPAEQEAFPDSAAYQMPGRAISLLPAPRRMRIAGGNRQSREIIQDTLGKVGLVVSIENQVSNAPERLEFENALWQVQTVILPALIAQKRLSKAQAQALSTQVQDGIYTIGRQRQVFDTSELMAGEPVSLQPDMSGDHKTAPPPLKPEDALLLASLCQYAEVSGLSKEQALFKRLALQVAEHCQQH